MFDWEKKLKELNRYNISFEIKQGYYHISLTYDEGWEVLVPENKSIYLEERNGLYHYIALIDSIKIEDMFTTINDTIEYNMDLQKKLLLFKEKTIELQELFANEKYETLQTIRFIYEKSKEDIKKDKNKKKRGRKSKKELEEIKENITENKEEETKDVKDYTSEKIIDKEKEVLNNFDTEEEIVQMDGEFIEELERK